MKQAKCFTCERLTANLLTANCRHKICFNCVKNNRSSHKCSICSSSKNKSSSYSPFGKVLMRQKQDGSRNKSIQSTHHDQSSPFITKSSRKSNHIQSCSSPINQSPIQTQLSFYLKCKQHNQPLSLFSKSTQQAICSVCLCSKKKYKDQIMPIKGAENYLRRENHTQREQSRGILIDVQNCAKIIKGNVLQFQLYYANHCRILGQVFDKLHKTLQSKQSQLRVVVDKFFLQKMKQCREIQSDLKYLQDTLRSYRQQNKQTNTLNELLYVYSSFKVIKQTVKTLNFDYISYSNQNINLFQLNKNQFDIAITNLLKFKQNLPLKQQDKTLRSSKKRSQSNKSFSKSKNQQYNEVIFNQLKTPIKGLGSGSKYTQISSQQNSQQNRQQMSICSNSSAIEMTQDQRNLYKRLLKSRFLKG